MSNSLNTKVKEQFDHDDSGGSLNTNHSDFLDSESASGNSINTQWRDWSSGTGVSLNNRLMNKHGGSGSFNTRWKNWVAFSSTHSFNLDGSNDYLNIGTNSGIEFTGTQPFTISMWVNLDSVALMAFCYKRDGVNGYIWQVHDDGTLEFSTGTGSALIASRTTTTISANEWTHIAVVRTASEGKALFYKNGSLMSMNGSHNPDHTSMSDNSTIPLSIGEHGGSRYFNGKIDEFSMFDAELSASDVTSIYNNGKVIDLSKSTAYGVDRTGNLKLWLRCGDKAEPESNTAIARQDFYTDFDSTDDYIDVGSDSSIDNI